MRPWCRGVIYKYTAYALAGGKPDREFVVKDGTATLLGKRCPTAPVDGGRIYMLDVDFNEDIKAFVAE